MRSFLSCHHDLRCHLRKVWRLFLGLGSCIIAYRLKPMYRCTRTYSERLISQYRRNVWHVLIMTVKQEKILSGHGPNHLLNKCVSTYRRPYCTRRIFRIYQRLRCFHSILPQHFTGRHDGWRYIQAMCMYHYGLKLIDLWIDIFPSTKTRWYNTTNPKTPTHSAAQLELLLSQYSIAVMTKSQSDSRNVYG